MPLLLRSSISVVLLVAGASLAAQQAPDSSKAARAFVEAFYRWYVPVAAADHQGPADAIAVKQKRTLFSPELYRALKADLDAQAKVSGEIVGLDSDPFLNSQDPCTGFEIGAVTRRRDSFRVQFFAVCDGKRVENPSVLAEVRAATGHWEFINFYDAIGKNNLLATLKILAADRRK